MGKEESTMFILIYTLIWLVILAISCLFSFFLGRVPVFDSSGLPWVVHRGLDPVDYGYVNFRTIRWPGA
jgi:hypothetical protein